jgi:hypothetical protein
MFCCAGRVGFDVPAKMFFVVALLVVDELNKCNKM